ncbi:MAG: hypothetical protein WAU01_00605, partial [Saprospiraceae bacterium]
MRWKILVLLISLYSLAYAQSGFTTLGGANFLGYGRAGVNVHGIQSAYLNQAGLSEISNTALDVSLERRFNF